MPLVDGEVVGGHVLQAVGNVTVVCAQLLGVVRLNKAIIKPMICKNFKRFIFFKLNLMLPTWVFWYK